MFSAELQYAVIFLHEVKNAPNLEPTTVDAVAKKYDLKREFLFKVTGKLRLAEYIKSVRGPGGGYLKNKDLSEVDFWKLYQSIHLINSRLSPATTNKKANAIINEAYGSLMASLGKCLV